MEARRSWHSVSRSKFSPVLLLLLAGGFTGVTWTQTSSQLPGGAASRPTLSGASDARDPHDPFAEQAASKMTHLREDERRKRLMTDTARLVALTNELKAQVDNTTRDELSLDVIRKATEIEKLARDVRERMKN